MACQHLRHQATAHQDVMTRRVECLQEMLNNVNTQGKTQLQRVTQHAVLATERVHTFERDAKQYEQHCRSHTLESQVELQQSRSAYQELRRAEQTLQTKLEHSADSSHDPSTRLITALQEQCEILRGEAQQADKQSNQLRQQVHEEEGRQARPLQNNEHLDKTVATL